MLADMGGQLFVRLVEVPESVPGSIALDEAPLPAFLRMPFAEAVQAFLARQIVTPEEFAQLTDAGRARSFTATRLAADGLVERVRALLADHLARGGTLEQFQAELGPDTLGITAASPWYLETIYRTNVQMAYGAGRLRQLTSPIVIEARPFVEYRTVGDNRVRPAHAALDRVQFDQRDPSWQRYAPPNGYNCRCSVVAVREADRSRLRTSSEIQTQPDPGFDAPPTGEEI